MLNSKKTNYTKYLAWVALAMFVPLAFIFKKPLLENFLRLYTYGESVENTILNVSERENYEILKLDNQVLKEELKKIKNEVLLAEDGMKPAFVKLITQPSEIYGDFYTTVPKERTVYKGMNLFVGGNIIIGIIEDAGEQYLKVARPGVRTSFIAEELNSGENLELWSKGAGFYAGNVPASSKFAVGDTIVLKGYPKAIVGIIVEILKTDSALSTVYIRTPYSISQKEIFYVLQ